ncbi:hypothetical protein PSTH1771_28070 [Pseudomonas syringae pv. theae]|nr:hypothetical protein PSTH1771_28070 [Pseudomonas syringae pv. theae]
MLRNNHPDDTGENFTYNENELGRLQVRSGQPP